MWFAGLVPHLRASRGRPDADRHPDRPTVVVWPRIWIAERVHKGGDPVNRNALIGLSLTVTLAAAALTAGCGNSTSSGGTGKAGAAPLIGVDYPRSDTDFWNSYIRYVPQMAKELSVELKTTNS